MIRRLLPLALLLCAAPVQAQTFASNTCSSGDSGSSTCAATAFSTLTAGALVVVVVRVPNTTDTVTGITGCGSGWNRAFSRVSSNERNETWYAPNLGAISCAPVPTWSGVDPGARMVGAEFGGIATASPLDVTASSTSTGTSFTSTATATLAQSANMAVGTCANNDYQTNFTMGGTYSRAYPPTSTDVNRLLIAYRVTSSTSAETFTASGDNSTVWSCGVAIFKATGGGGGAAPKRLMTLGVGDAQ